MGSGLERGVRQGGAYEDRVKIAARGSMALESYNARYNMLDDSLIGRDKILML